MMINPTPDPNSFWGVIASALAGLSLIGVSYFQFRKPKIDKSTVDELKKSNKLLEKDNNLLNLDIVRLTEQVNNYSKEREQFEVTIEKIHSEHKEQIASAISQYKIKVRGIFQSTNLVLSHVTDYIENEQQASLLKDLQKTLQNEIN